MITAILAFFQAVPALVGGLNNFMRTYFDAKVKITAARLGADENVIRQALMTAGLEGQTGVDRLRVIAGSKVLLAICVGFAVPLILYEWQCIVYDKLIMHGATATDPIKGQIADWANTIITGIFGAPAAVAISHAWLNRKSS